MNIKIVSQTKRGIHKVVDRFDTYLWNQKWREVTKKGTGRTFYVIRRGHANVGLFSYVTVAMGHIYHAIEIGAIPIIDMKNYENTYLDRSLLCKENAWEYFYEQPMGYRLEDIRSEDTVIYSYGGPLKYTVNTRSIYDRRAFKEWREIYNKYIRINQECMAEIEKQFKRLFANMDMNKVLGVKLRGTDYIRTKPLHHPIQPTVSEALPQIQSMLKKYDLSKIYLQTEDANILAEMKDIFGDKLIVPESCWYNTEKKQLITSVLQENNDMRQNGMEYLRDTYFLSQCQYLVAGLNGGSLMACLMGNYKDCFIFNLGYYGERET